MKRWVVAGWVALGMLTLAGTAQAGPCDHHTNAFAYNDCLSRQSAPLASSGRRASGGDPEKTVPATRRRGRVVRGGGNPRGMVISRQGGRVRATIDPWVGMRGAPGKKRRR